MSTQSSKPGDTSAGLLHNYLSLLSQLNSTKATTRRRGASPPELHLRNKHYDHAELGYKYKASVKTLEIPLLSAQLTQQRCNWICSLLLSSRTRVTVQQHDTAVGPARVHGASPRVTEETEELGLDLNE